MSQEEQEPPMPEAGTNLPLASALAELLSRFVPAGSIQAETITATNVVSGLQLNVLGAPIQQRTPPLQRPRRAEHFTDRAAEQAWLLDRLHPGQIVTISGPGGMGKTALVAEMLWSLVPGDSPPTRFPHGIVFHSFYGQPDAAVALEQLARTFGEDPLPTPAEAARRALGGKRALLVLDGAEEAQNLEQVLAVSGSCAVLVTSRRRNAAADPALLLDLQRLPQSEAVAVVQAWQAQRQADEAVTLRICQLVGGLPLALRLAGSYLALHPEEGEEYLAWLEEDLLGALDQGSSSRKSVPVLLERSVARLRPEAQTVLRLVGLMALAPFARELVADVLEFAPAAAWRALDEVVDYGLLVRVGASYEVSHPLIHTYARQVLLAGQEATQQAALVASLVTVLAEHFPEVDHANWEACERLVPHIQACAAQLEQQSTAQVEAAALFIQAGRYLRDRARYDQAAPLLQRALAIREQQLGPKHPGVAYTLNDLAGLYSQQGKYAEAKPLFLRALRIRMRQLGPKHPNVAYTLNNLAYLYRRQGKYVEAKSLILRALRIRMRQLGPKHPQVASIFNNLAYLYLEQGKYAEAKSLFLRALAIREQQLGPEHPDVADSLSYLASFYRQQGKYAEAEPLYQRALGIREQQLGPGHPFTANSLNDLAMLYWEQGKYAEAEPLFQRALAIREQQLGPQHPSTATSLHNLAVLYQDQGKYAEAEPLLQRALTIREQQLGPQHPDTATTLENYAFLLRRMHRSNEAMPLEQRARAIRAERQHS